MAFGVADPGYRWRDGRQLTVVRAMQRARRSTQDQQPCQRQPRLVVLGIYRKEPGVV